MCCISVRAVSTLQRRCCKRPIPGFNFLSVSSAVLTPGWQLIDEGGTRWVREDELDAERGVSALIPALSRTI